MAGARRSTEPSVPARVLLYVIYLCGQTLVPRVDLIAQPHSCESRPLGAARPNYWSGFRLAKRERTQDDEYRTIRDGNARTLNR